MFGRKFGWVVLALGILLATSRGRAAVLDGNFEESNYVFAAAEITSMAWAPDASQRLFLTRKGGQVLIVKNGVLLATAFATLNPVYTASECGLLGVAFDPDFSRNGYVYFFVTISASTQQIVRYTANGDVGTDRTVIVSDLPTAGQNHDGGALGFGPDGKLYWGIGDLGNGTGVDADLTSLAAKIGRVNRDGSLPTDNPFSDGAGSNDDRIWARGFRNPYTLSFQPSTGQLWINTVGTSYEQVFRPSAGDHAGYNDYENNQPTGYLSPVIAYRTNGTSTFNISSALRSGGTATFSTTTNPRLRSGARITVAGVADTSFNGVGFVTSASSTGFSFAQAGADATSSGGTATTENIGGCITG
ncbi:MAG TPA: PQQ-dependent sugar dehydrogenase, partial [Polyangiaceae bacterium]